MHYHLVCITPIATMYFNIHEWQSKTISRRAHFLWSHKVCFSYRVPADRFNWVLVRTHSNDMISMLFTCLISSGLLAEATPKHSVRLKETQLRAFQTNHVRPSVRALRSEHFAICINITQSRAASINALKIKHIYKYIQNHYSKIMMISKKWNTIYVYLYSLTFSHRKGRQCAHNAGAN